MATPRSITGNTLRVYLHLLTHGPCELREVQRGVGLSTPSLASYHLGRLTDFGYVKQDRDGRYMAVKESSSEILSGYSRIGPALIPQFFFFTVFFTVLIGFFSYQALVVPGYTIYLAIVALLVVVFMWYETLRLWRKLIGELSK